MKLTKTSLARYLHGRIGDFQKTYDRITAIETMDHVDYQSIQRHKKELESMINEFEDIHNKFDLDWSLRYAKRTKTAKTAGRKQRSDIHKGRAR